MANWKKGCHFVPSQQTFGSFISDLALKIQTLLTDIIEMDTHAFLDILGLESKPQIHQKLKDYLQICD